MKNSYKENPEKVWGWVVISCMLVVFLYLGSWTYITCQLKDWSERGNFGDMFGAINALFAGLAFAGVIIAIVLQYRILQLQKKELEETRKEFRGQKEQLTRQADYLSEQNFENKFFQLLNIHLENVRAMTLFIRRYKHEHDVSETYAGQEYFGKLHSLINLKLPTDAMNNFELHVAAKKAFQELYQEHRANLGHYFKLLYNMFKFVHSSNSRDKQFYVSLIMAELSSYELSILFYNCLSKQGEAFYEYAVTYSLFEHLDLDLIKNIGFLALYPKSVYGNREDGSVLDSLTFINEPEFNHS